MRNGADDGALSAMSMGQMAMVSCLVTAMSGRYAMGIGSGRVNEFASQGRVGMGAMTMTVTVTRPCAGVKWVANDGMVMG